MPHKSSRKIKICYVASADITLRFILSSQLRFLQSRGYDVHAVCSPGSWVGDIARQGVKVKTVKIKRKMFSPFSDLAALISLWMYFKRERFDIVHTHTPKPGFIGQLAAKWAGVPIIVNTIHGFYFQQNSSPFKKEFLTIIERIAAQCSDAIFFVNKEDMNMAVKKRICPEAKIKYFGGGVDMNRFNQDLFSPAFIAAKKEAVGIKARQQVVGIVARLVKEKGYVDLFGAFKMVIKKFPEAILLIVGQEEKEKKDFFDVDFFRKKYALQKNVVFLGEREDVDEIYSLMDLFVLPSYREGLGISVLEASAMAKAVVATDIRGLREAVDNGKTGVLVPVKNPEKLALAIIYFLENPLQARQMGENGRMKVMREFDEKLVFDRIQRCYESLVEEKLERKKPGKKLQSAIKRCFDIAGSLVGLIILSPVFLVVALLIRIDSGSPVFFRYERIGKDGKSFYPFKFRTMVQGAIGKGLGVNISEKDERITRIGGFLRKWGIDEFPQLINVLKGEMSIVGPRPTFKYQTEKYSEFEKKRLWVKPGLVGWALIHGRNSLTWEQRIAYDTWYVDHWSLWLDLTIIFKSFYLIFIKQEGVYGKGGINDDPFI